MKVFLIHQDKRHEFDLFFRTGNRALFYFNSSALWLHLMVNSECAVGAAHIWTCRLLSFLNDELKLNGTIVRQKHRTFLQVKEEALFQLQLSILDYKEFEY
jgi:hypothetical protein